LIKLTEERLPLLRARIEEFTYQGGGGNPYGDRFGETGHVRWFDGDRGEQIMVPLES